MTRAALVLGAGGITGVAWQLGVVIGLRRHGVDPAAVDRVVGTSAGAITGALLSTGVDTERAAVIEETVPTRIQPDWDSGARAFMLFGDQTLDPGARRAALGAIAASAVVGDEDGYVDSIGRRLPVTDWPASGRLLVTAVDTATGDPVVWDRAGSAPLVRAVAASCAVPCVFPPVTIDGRRYMDGGVRSQTNADLALGADAMLVLAPRLPGRLRPGFLPEVAALGDPRALVVRPDAEAVAAVGDNVFDTTRWRSTVEAGIVQGASLAPTVAAHLRI